jgi:RNA polymerase sigma factor (TIGR02999 family)
LGDSDTHQITVLLHRWREGDARAADDLAPLVYQELRRLAQNYMRLELGERTLQPTELVHEVYLKLFQAEPLDWQDRTHFFAVAARQIRHLLVDTARRRMADKRGGGALRVDLTDALPAPGGKEDDLLAINEALEELERIDEGSTKILELRLFGGFTENEAARLLGISPAKARRDWDFARAWLLNRLRP